MTQKVAKLENLFYLCLEFSSVYMYLQHIHKQNKYQVISMLNETILKEHLENMSTHQNVANEMTND